MRKILIPLIALGGVGAQCNPQQQARSWSEYRLDRAGEGDLIDSHSARMCVSPNGNAYVVWIDNREGLPDLWFNRKLAGEERADGWFDQAVKINTFAGSNIWNPDIACSDSGVYIVWEDDRDGEVESHQIYFQRSIDNGQSWMAEDLLLEDDEDGRSNSFNPDIVVEGPNVYVTWSDNANGAFDILFIRSTDSGITFQDPKRIDSDEPPGSAYSAFPRLATGFGGDNVYITWQDFRNGGVTVNGGSDVYFARSTDKGQTFGSDVRLDTGEDPGLHDSFVPQIAADDDDVYVVWHDDRFGESNDALMNYSSDGGVTWNTSASAADAVDNRGRNQSLYPKVCASGATGHVVWHDNRNQGFYRTYYNRAVGGAWVGEEIRLDPNKEQGQRASRDTHIDCDGDNVAAVWLDETHDEQDFGFNDVAYNYSADGGETWLVGEESETYRLDSVEEGSSFKEDITIDLKGNVLKAAWTDGRGGSTDIYYQQVTIDEETDPVIYEVRDVEE